jgi:predicted nucleic-acid-binding Zn-ribbon protein
MSYYSIYPDINIEYMICSICSTEAFSWLAEVFSCPVCGSDDYSSVQTMVAGNAPSRLYTEEEIQIEYTEQYQEELHGHLAKPHHSEASQRMCGRKRKRSLSDI